MKTELDLLRSSELFDHDWYLSAYPDVALAKSDPAEHYLTHGGMEGRDPGPKFNSRWYLETYPDVKSANVNPLIHYIQFGKREGRLPQPRNIDPSEFQCSCPLCKTRFEKFAPLGPSIAENLTKAGSKFSLDDFETLNREQHFCPNCGANDRDRLYASYLETRIPLMPSDGEIALLDIAPTPHLSRFIDHFSNITHHTADLFMDGVDLKIDITSMPEIATSTYDIFICSHVLEHVKDDKKALAELFRILKPGGWGIVMVPINLAVNEIDEDPEVTDIAERWRRFGQNDHVRLYSKQGFINRIEGAGFFINQLGLDHFGEVVFTQFGITNKSVLYIAEKRIG